MKRLSFFLAALVLCTVVALGQKPKVNKIEMFLKNDDVPRALEMVDLAVDYEKTKDDPKTYYLRGLTYAIIDTSSVHGDLRDNARQIAVESFDKAEEMAGDEELTFTTLDGESIPMSQHRQIYWAYFFNKGATHYGNENYQEAVDQFTIAQMINPEDTNSYINAGLAAQNIEDYEAAKRNYQLAIDNGTQSKDIYNLLIYIVGTVDGNEEGALELTRQAMKVYPDDTELARSEISLLIALEKVDQALINIEKQITEDPNDPALHFTLGILHDRLSEDAETEEEKKAMVDKAMASYQKAVEVDPEYYVAHYNIGVILIGRANEIVKEYNNLGVSNEDLEKAEKMDPIIDERFMKALPQWEKIYELKPDDRPTLETLSYLYEQLEMYDQKEKIMAELDALGDSEDN